MTIAVCLNCASIKHGAFTTCICGFRPITTIDFCISATFTDRFQKVSLSALQELIKLCNKEKYWAPTYELVITSGILEKYIQNPNYRKLIQLKNTATKGWIRDEIDMHSTGPDGYKNSVLVSGRDIDKLAVKAARQIGDDAFYCLWTYEN